MAKVLRSKRLAKTISYFFLFPILVARIVLNGIFMMIPLKICFVDKIYNKYKCSYNIGDNQKIIADIIKYDIANLGDIKLCLSPNSETD